MLADESIGSSAVVVGKGRVGKALLAGLEAAGIPARGLSGRRTSALGWPPDEILPALVLLAVPDDALEGLATALAPAIAASASKPRVLHVSGAQDSAVLGAARAAGASCGSLHPLQSFSGAADPRLFQGIVFAVEGDTEAVATARSLARRLGGEPIEVPAGARPVYHLAASMAANGLVGLLAAAEDLLGTAGFAPDVARRALGPLVRRAVENDLDQGPRAALTGPVARGDEATIARHRATLAAVSPERLALYEALVVEQRRVVASVEPSGGPAG